MGLLFTKSQSFSHQSSFSFIFFHFYCNQQMHNCIGYNKIKYNKIIIRVIKDVQYMYEKLLFRFIYT